MAGAWLSSREIAIGGDSPYFGACGKGHAGGTTVAGTAFAAYERMPRALWKGAINFGLVTVPIGLHSAIEAREELAFNLLHKKDGSRIVQKRFCKEEDAEVPWSDVVKGYQYAKDEYVVLTDEDFEKARVPATQMFARRSRGTASFAMPSARQEGSALGRSSCASVNTSGLWSRLAMPWC